MRMQGPAGLGIGAARDRQGVERMDEPLNVEVAELLSPQQEEELAAILEEYVAEIERGFPPDPDRLIAQHPGLEGPLRTHLANVRMLHRMCQESPAPGAGGWADLGRAAVEPQEAAGAAGPDGQGVDYAEHGAIHVRAWMGALNAFVRRFVPHQARRAVRVFKRAFPFPQVAGAQRAQPIRKWARAVAGLPARKEPWQISADGLRRIERQGLFLVGNARSGTSIFCDCLNLAPQILLLGEASLFSTYRHPDFVEGFNRRHVGYGNRRGKGTFLPPAPGDEEGGLAALLRMGRAHRYVGEKIAFGPHGLLDGQTHQETFLQFHARYFYRSHYLLILRKPAECVWSMCKMFPQTPIAELVDCWLETVKVQLDVYHLFPHVQVVFFDNLNQDTYRTIAATLGVALEVPPGMMREEYKHSKLNGQLPRELRSWQAVLERCRAIYDDLQAEFDPFTLQVTATCPRYLNACLGFSERMQSRIEALQAEVKAVRAVTI